MVYRKCPFGGDAAGASGMNIDESEESELEESESESEVELDMEGKCLKLRIGKEIIQEYVL